MTGVLYGRSSRMLHVDGQPLPYAVNHTITYQSEAGRRMPYLVQRLSVDDIGVRRSAADDAVHYSLTSAVRKGGTSSSQWQMQELMV